MERLKSRTAVRLAGCPNAIRWESQERSMRAIPPRGERDGGTLLDCQTTLELWTV